jgi:GTP pyrophosphokinase
MAISPQTESEFFRPLVDELVALVGEYDPDAEGDEIRRAFRFAAERHQGQQRKSGEPFVVHPLGVAKITAELRQEPAVVTAALLHDVVEDTETTLDELRSEFGDEVATLVEGVTKIGRMKFASREEAQAENYRKMVLSMAQDVRVIVLKLADRLHNMRTLGPLAKQKQQQTARETLEVYAPLAHRLGIHTVKWELEDLAFATLHPRKYAEIEAMVNQRRNDREQFVEEAGAVLDDALQKVGINAEIRGRAKHFYSIYVKMAKRGKEFNEIFDLTAMRVIVDSVKDCYGAIGIIHSLWKPMPGRFKDYVAMPKSNGYQSLHTTVIGPHGKPLEIQVRTQAMHQTAEFGIAAHWLYKRKPGHGSSSAQLPWFRQVMDAAASEGDAGDFMESLRVDLFDDEVFVFTPKGEVRALAAGATPLDFAYAVHTDVGHRCVGAKVNGRIVPLHYRLQSGEFVEILTSKSERGPSRDWASIVKTSRARNKIRQWFAREQRDDLDQRGRDSLQQALRSHGLPHQKIASSALLAQIIREMGFKKAEDFYIAIGSGKVQVGQVANKVLQRLKTSSVETEEQAPVVRRRGTRGPVRTSKQYGVIIEGVTDPDVLVRMAKCCTPVPGDPITGYISVGRGITVHRVDCPNARALMRTPERFCEVEWDDHSSQSFRVEIAVTSWDRPRLLEDVARTFGEFGCNIVEYGGVVQDQMARNWYVVELGDVKVMKSLLSALKHVDAVFDAYRVTPRSEGEENGAG